MTSRQRWRDLPEVELHDRVAEVEGHESQVRGVVGYFYRQYMREVRQRVDGHPGREVLEVGCGEGMMFADAAIRPVQLDVSPTRLARARGKGEWLVCADAYHLPFAGGSFALVLLIAVLEHTRRPWDILAEAHRVLRPGGRVIILVPNDVALSLGRLLLLKFPPRYPDHLTFTTPRRVRRWLAGGFDVVEAFPLPFRSLAFAVNLYYFVVARKRAPGAP